MLLWLGQPCPVQWVPPSPLTLERGIRGIQSAEEHSPSLLEAFHAPGSSAQVRLRRAHAPATGGFGTDAPCHSLTPLPVCCSMLLDVFANLYQLGSSRERHLDVRGMDSVRRRREVRTGACSFGSANHVQYSGCHPRRLRLKEASGAYKARRNTLLRFWKHSMHLAQVRR